MQKLRHTLHFILEDSKRIMCLNKKLAVPYFRVEKGLNWDLWKQLKPIMDERVISDETVKLHQNKSN